MTCPRCAKLEDYVEHDGECVLSQFEEYDPATGWKYAGRWYTEPAPCSCGLDAALASPPAAPKEATHAEQCSYCGGFYPYPIGHHHDQDECAKVRTLAVPPPAAPVETKHLSLRDALDGRFSVDEMEAWIRTNFEPVQSQNSKGDLDGTNSDRP